VRLEARLESRRPKEVEEEEDGRGEDTREDGERLHIVHKSH
jgi:hypothetical protein